MKTPTHENLAESHRARLALSPGSVALDDRTWSDLDLDAVFSKIDHTASTLGQQALYHRLRSTYSSEHLAAFEALVDRFATNANDRARARRSVGKLRDPQGYNLWWMGQPKAIDARPWFAVFPVLTVAALVGIALIPISAIPVVAILAINLFVRAVTHHDIGRITRAFRQLAPVIAAAQSLRFLAGDASPAIGRTLVEDAARLRRLKMLSRWANENPLMLSLSANPLAMMANDFVSVVYEYVNTLLLLDATGVYFGARDLRLHCAALLRVVGAIGDVDAATSVAQYRETQPLWVRPGFSDDGAVVAVDLCHPLLNAPVANSISLHLGEGVLVTGSNMSGKSTFLRTIGVNAVMAQTINTCIAREYRSPRFRVRSSIGRKDSLLEGKSYYVVEVEALVELLQASQSREPHLILLDELFHGTNTVERIAAGDAVLHSLLAEGRERKPHVVIAATHDLELMSLLSGVYAAYHFGDAISDAGPVFDHRLKAGASTNRTALALLRQKGAPAGLLERADATAGRLDQRATLQQL
jgi:hypothetical protein